ncbi:hypothetical protein NC651_009865 [Populus alba x Populus x berolinensis]|nr:hypothetical protein NC651_009865 [Populus alba x Populus x berolinensis]
MVVAPLLSLLCKTLLLCHRDPNSRSNHLAQKFVFSFSAVVRVATLYLATPTVPTASFPSHLQAFASSSSSCNQSQPPTSPPTSSRTRRHQSSRELLQRQQQKPNLKWMILSRINELEGVPNTVGKLCKDSRSSTWVFLHHFDPKTTRIVEKVCGPYLMVHNSFRKGFDGIDGSRPTNYRNPRQIPTDSGANEPRPSDTRNLRQTHVDRPKPTTLEIKGRYIPIRAPTCWDIRTDLRNPRQITTKPSIDGLGPSNPINSKQIPIDSSINGMEHTDLRNPRQIPINPSSDGRGPVDLRNSKTNTY